MSSGFGDRVQACPNVIYLRLSQALVYPFMIYRVLGLQATSFQKTGALGTNISRWGGFRGGFWGGSPLGANQK